MTSQSGSEPVERGGGEEAAGVPSTPAEEETSRRPAGSAPDQGRDTEVNPYEFLRSKELNPDDFE